MACMKLRLPSPEMWRSSRGRTRRPAAPRWGEKWQRVCLLLFCVIVVHHIASRCGMLATAARDSDVVLGAFHVPKHDDVGQGSVHAKPAFTPLPRLRGDGSPAVLMTVHGALEYVQGALQSLSKHTATSVQLYVADDCGNATETKMLGALLASTPLNSTHIVVGSTPQGYTKAINMALAAAMRAGHSVLVCMNSDVVVTRNWLAPLVSAIQLNPDIGMAGPTSNAATYQSLPLVTGADGKWARNPLAPGWTPAEMGELAFLASKHKLIDVPILNGFVMAIARNVIETIGYMDEDRFPQGYGEENDFAIRTSKAGFRKVVVPWSYVYHHKTKSFTAAERATFAKHANTQLATNYRAELTKAVQQLKHNEELRVLRAAFQYFIPKSLTTLVPGVNSVLFILNPMREQSFMLHGGWISLVQEALGLVRNGIHARIAVQMWTVPFFSAEFLEAQACGLFIGYQSKTEADIAHELLNMRVLYHMVIATHFKTVPIVLQICRQFPHIMKGYYVQDIETKFSSAGTNAAVDGYESMRDGFIFVKTAWLAQQLAATFNISAYTIPPTVDTRLFTPQEASVNPTKRLHLCAMVRVQTPRRKPGETLKILSSVVRSHGDDAVQATAFGSDPEAIHKFVQDNNLDASVLQGIELIGTQNRSTIASLLRTCSIFLDFSAWQAFGRSGLEAMASGCVPILPVNGGATQYAKHGHNAFLVNTTDFHNGVDIIDSVISGVHDIGAMRAAAIETAQDYTMDKSSAKTSLVFREYSYQWRSMHASVQVH